MTSLVRIRQGVFAIVIALAAALFPATAKADTVYVAGLGNEFGTLNLTTGAFTQVGTLNLPSGDMIYGMGFGADGNLYGLDLQSSAHLFRINPTNASVTDLGSIGQSAIGATTDASGKMYALTQDLNAVFYTLNPPATTTHVVGSTGLTAGSGGLVAVNPAGTQLFTSEGHSNNLDSVNLSTGVATPIGNTGFMLDAGLFVNGTLYGFDVSGTFAIVAVNTTTGAGTQVATYSLPNQDVILAAAETSQNIVVPEPTGVTLCIVAAIGSVGYLRRQRAKANVAL